MSAPLHLSPRQIEVCVLVGGGDSYKRTGEALGIDVETVKLHLRLGAAALRSAYPLLRVYDQPGDVARGWLRECRRIAYFSQGSAA